MSAEREAAAVGDDDLDSVDPGLFARRLEELFRTVPGPNGRAYSAKAIAARSTDRGFRLGESYLSQLRSGKAKSPSFRTVEGIAAAFGVDVHYFLEDHAAQRTRDQIDMMRMQADTDVQVAAFGLAGLSSDSVFVVSELIKVLRRQQGLPADPPDLVSAINSDALRGAPGGDGSSTDGTHSGLRMVRH